MSTKQKISKLMKLKPELTFQPTITGIPVFVVDRTWHFELMQFLAGSQRESQFPKSCWSLNDAIVRKADSGRSFLYQMDFEVIPNSLRFRFEEIFGRAPRNLIEGNLVLSPTGRPTFLRLGTEITFNIYLPRGTETRMCGPNWFVLDIERDACSRHKLDNHRLFVLGGREPINSSLKIEELQSQGNSGLSLKPFTIPANQMSTSSSSRMRSESPRGRNGVTTEAPKISSPRDRKNVLDGSSSLSFASSVLDDSQGRHSTNGFTSGVTAPPTQVSSGYGQSFQTGLTSRPRSRDRSEAFRNSQPDPVVPRYGSSVDQKFDDSPSSGFTRVSALNSGRTVGPVGLQNLGNTCFMNAPLQCLMRVKRLTDYLLSGGCQAARNPRNPLGSRCQVLDSYCALLREVSNARCSVSPTDLKRAIAQHNSTFSGYGQHDANEFLTTLLDALHEDLNQSRTATGSHLNLEHLSGMELHHFCNQSIIVDLFHGETSTKLTFPCGARQDIRELFALWVIPLPPGDNNASLANCIRSWEQEQHMTGENGLWCERCDRIENVRRQTTVVRFPSVLIIQLKRFTDNDGRLSKNSTSVSYPLQFNQSQGTYHLTGVVHHSGTLSGGHYTCLVRDSPTSSQWYEISDSNISPVRGDWGSNITDSSAMILFYQS
jgi:ubiquitin carboxyl-terminal hydrolase 8